MIYCPVSELAFSQVREDPLIELTVVKQLLFSRNQTNEETLKTLIIASGGCTALSLLTIPQLEIEAVDLNPAQLHLVELRRQALLHLCLDEQLQLIGADVATPETERLLLYTKLRSHLPELTKAFWDKRQEEIAFGVNRVGKFEQLFRELAAKIADLGLNPLESPKDSSGHAEWQSIFESIFERDKLAKTFGEAPVNYSMDRSFGEHFADVFARALKRFSPDNYFLTQVWKDCYSTGVEGVPIYLQPSAQKVIRSLGTERLRLHQGAFAEKMPELAEVAKFDLIQFSNISDWMPLVKLNQMLKTAVSCLKPGGALIGRRLNGDHYLAEIMNKHLPVDKEFCENLLQIDRSFFYREVVVGFNY
ncbi:MAG: BtaA family protein [Scytonematopsis contorta HA4267-MV1]|jgi:S-adenosylmethionine-diacylglycerol 3-amino-3-carboxypropyl transferase|nr:BtaA family protein [Scytonematopsis contorta HA4267-MV1]